MSGYTLEPGHNEGGFFCLNYGGHLIGENHMYMKVRAHEHFIEKKFLFFSGA